MATPATELRHKLRAAGFDPLPLKGKIPVLTEWQKRTNTSAGDINIWEKLYPYAENTGVLTRLAPCLIAMCLIPPLPPRSRIW
jgi:hypothetical protein